MNPSEQLDYEREINNRRSVLLSVPILTRTAEAAHHLPPIHDHDFAFGHHVTVQHGRRNTILHHDQHSHDHHHQEEEDIYTHFLRRSSGTPLFHDVSLIEDGESRNYSSLDYVIL